MRDLDEMMMIIGETCTVLKEQQFRGTWGKSVVSLREATETISRRSAEVVMD